MINPASKNRRNYWAAAAGLPDDPQQWLDSAQQVQGSWWPHFADWLARRSGARVPAPQRLGSEKYPEIEPAPGRYVKVRDHEAERGAPV